MYKDVYRNRSAALALIREAMEDGRGALFGVPGHAMVLVHYDEATNTVKWVDNSDRSLRIQTMTISRFNKRWDGWICVIYADPDVVPWKSRNWINKIPIIDHNNPSNDYPKDYIPMPEVNDRAP